MPERHRSERPLRAIVIFNPASGRPEQSPQQLVDILTEMQKHHILPEVHIVHPDSNLERAVRNAIRAGIRLVTVAGGDGTIDSVIGAMIGSSAALGIIPTGTRNNVSFNLGIPATIPEAVALLRRGHRLKIDVGYLRSGRSSRWFLEAASLGLISDMFPAADQLQHGDLAQIGALLSTFVSSTPSRLRAIFPTGQRLDSNAYMVLIANMPYLGPRLEVAPRISCLDSRLDVFIFSDMTKLDLISYALRTAAGPVDDTHLRHHRVSQLLMRSDPPMPVLADGYMLDSGPVALRVHPRALTVITGASGPAIGRSSVHGS